MNNNSKTIERYNLFGVMVSVVDYKGAEEAIIQAAKS